MSRMNWDKAKRRPGAYAHMTGRVAKADLPIDRAGRDSVPATFHPSSRNVTRLANPFKPGSIVQLEKRWWGAVIDSNRKTTSFMVGPGRRMVAATAELKLLE